MAVEAPAPWRAGHGSWRLSHDAWRRFARDVLRAGAFIPREQLDVEVLACGHVGTRYMDAACGWTNARCRGPSEPCSRCGHMYCEEHLHRHVRKLRLPRAAWETLGARVERAARAVEGGAIMVRLPPRRAVDHAMMQAADA